VAENFTLTGGIGWGRLSGIGGFENPLCAVADSFCTRTNDYGEGGTVDFGSFFHGEESALFGGVEWRATPQFTLKAEYSSDAYVREQEKYDFERKSPMNFGAEYRWREGVTLGAYYMYGDTAGFNLVLSGNPNKPLTPQNLGDGPLPVNPVPPNAPQGTGWASNPTSRDQLAAALSEALEAEGIRLDEMCVTATTVEVGVTDRRYNRDPQAIGRTARILQTGMPPSVRTFRITPLLDGLRTATVTIDRQEFEGQVARWNAGEKSWETMELEGATPSLAGDYWRRDAYPDFAWSFVPAPYLYLLTPGDPIRLGLNFDLAGTVSLRPGLSTTVSISQPLINAPNDPEPSESELQPVRSDTPL
jgi:hypothetical protein